MRVCERVFCVGVGPGVDSLSPARSRRCGDARLASKKKLGDRASGEAG